MGRDTGGSLVRKICALETWGGNIWVALEKYDLAGFLFSSALKMSELGLTCC